MIISLTTIPSRLPHIKPCTDSLLKQGLPVHVFIPKVFKRKGVEFDGFVPDFLKDCHVHVVEDRGSLTKLLPGITMSDRVITADDDVVYPKNWAKRLIEYSDKFPKCVIAYRGRKLKKDVDYRKCHVVYNPPSPKTVNFITGVYGVIYRSKFFTDKFKHTEFSTVDDIVISAHLRKRNVPVLIIPSGDIEDMELRKKDRLWMLNRFENNKKLNELFW